MADLDKPENQYNFNDGKDLRLAIQYMKRIGKTSFMIMMDSYLL